MLWHRVASHLGGRTVQEAQETLTSTGFLKWVWYLDWRDTEEFHRQDYYLAQIAADIQRGQVKHPKRVKLQDKILKFTQTQKQLGTPDQRFQKSKNFWMSITGMIGNKKNQKKRKLPKRVK